MLQAELKTGGRAASGDRSEFRISTYGAKFTKLQENRAKRTRRNLEARPRTQIAAIHHALTPEYYYSLLLYNVIRRKQSGSLRETRGTESSGRRKKRTGAYYITEGKVKGEKFHSTSPGQESIGRLRGLGSSRGMAQDVPYPPSCVRSGFARR